MPTRFVTAIAVGVFLVAGLASHASALEEKIPIKISLLKWGGNPRVGKLFKIVSKAPNPPLFTLPSGDPVTQGGSLTVLLIGGTGSTGSLTCDLQAGAWDGTRGWKALGNPAGSKGYKYINKTAPTTDPCKIAIIKEKVIKVLAKSVGDITEPADTGNGDVSVVITAGGDSYCAFAAATHDKEKASKLIKMKNQGAPAACPTCGDNVANQLSETCDGTDDSACTCSGTCLPPGDPNECSCGSICGDDCVSGTEQCDGTEDDACPGLCLGNCTCPEPICNNGVKEVGEECDPAGSTADCPPGQICGGFCECVPDAACDCGDPSRYMYRNEPPVPGSVCGTTDGTALKDLACMGLYIGGGGGALPVPNFVPDQAATKFNIDQCVGTDLTLTTASPAEVGKRHCSEGKRCGSSATNAGDPCIRDRDCDGDNCNPQCWYGSYLTILNTSLPAISTCVSNEIVEDCTGGVDCELGKSFSRIPLDSVVHLTLLDQSPSTPGHNACPICVGGTLDIAGSGNCEGGPNSGQPCMPMSTSYDLYDCCSKTSSNNSKACTDDSDCPGGTCQTGCSMYPTSLDCPPHPLSKLGPGLLLTLQMNSEDETAYKNTVVANAEGYFCGWCRDVDDEGSGCFEGDPDEPSGGKGCPDSSVIACRPQTYHGGSGDPADLAECGDSPTCRTDADCTAPYETCGQRNPGAFRDATIETLIYNTATRAGDLRDFNWHDSTIVTNFCIPPNFDDVIDGDSDLGGPGGLSLVGKAKLSPSGAFIDAASGLLD